MRLFWNRLSTKLVLTTSVFLIVLAGAVAYLVTAGFHATEQNANQQSANGLKEQGQAVLLTLVEREGQLTTRYFQEPAASSRIAARYLESIAPLTGQGGWDASMMARHADGHLYDPRPTRQSDMFVPNYVDSADPAVVYELEHSAMLDSVAPSMLEVHRQAVAFYYASPHELYRYYPMNKFEGFVPPDWVVTNEPWFKPSAPDGNPGRQTTWSSLYMDDFGNGLMVTTCSPTYPGDSFAGVVCFDITLSAMIQHLESIKLTPSSYAFVVDNHGRVIAGPPIAIQELTGRAAIPIPEENNDIVGLTFRDPELLKLVQSHPTHVATVTINGREVFLASTALGGPNWFVGLVAPVDEVTAQAQSIAATIQSGTDETLQFTLLGLLGFFVLALLCTFILGRSLTRPMRALVEGTQRVARGELDVSIPVASRDELGLVAQSFNQMTADLAANRTQLEQWNKTLERTVQERTEALARAVTEADLARRAADEASHMKSKFLANMSHELRTPLNAIINFSHILSTRMHGPLTEKQADYLQRVRQGGEHLLGLINNILDLSKIEAGWTELDKESLDINALIRGVVSTAVGLTKDKPVELRHDLTPDLPPLEVDRTRIRQIVLNLISNAAKFTNEGSITVYSELRADMVVIRVVDTGIGIAPEDQATIFDEFQQVESEANRRYAGTGLGLAISRRLVELHGGTISVSSAPGAGSTFAFTLPVPQAALAPAADSRADGLATAGAAGSAASSSVLIIDDDPGAIEIITTYLNQDNYPVRSLTDSRTALSMAREMQPGIIILDILMPYKDGWDVLSELKEEPATQSIPVVLYSMVDEKKMAFSLGASAYLVKPVNEYHLRHTVARLIGVNTTVVVIDDDPNDREIVRAYLEQAGIYTVILAEGGKQGLEEIKRQPPDLIILDLMMPDIDGFEVLDQLDLCEETALIPVVVITAKILTEAERSRLNQRVQGLIEKGKITPAQFMQRVTKLALQPQADG